MILALAIDSLVGAKEIWKRDVAENKTRVWGEGKMSITLDAESKRSQRSVFLLWTAESECVVESGLT